MKTEILMTTPNSGEFTEIHFGENYNSQLWVKFTEDNFEEWVGCFSKSFENGLSKVLINQTKSVGFIIAGGRGYLIDITKKKLITKLDEHPLIESAIVTSNPDYFLAGTFYCIYILNEFGLAKEMRPEFTVNGIYLKDQIENKAVGELASAENQYEKNIDFEFDLITFKLSLKKFGIFNKIRNVLNVLKD